MVRYISRSAGNAHKVAALGCIQARSLTVVSAEEMSIPCFDVLRQAEKFKSRPVNLRAQAKPSKLNEAAGMLFRR